MTAYVLPIKTKAQVIVQHHYASQMAIVTLISLVYDWIIHKGDSGKRNIWAKF